MKKIMILAVLAVVLMTGPALAQTQTFNVMGSTYFHTVRVVTTDTSTLVMSAISGAFDPTKVMAMTITCETNDARIAFGTPAVLGASGVGHVLAAGAGGSRWPGNDMVTSAQIISKTSGAPAVLQITLEY